MQLKISGVIKILFAAIALAFMGYYLFNNWSTLKDYSWHFDLKLFLISAVVLWLALASAIFLYFRIFKSITDIKISYFQMFKIFNIANLGRYLPGKIWNIVGMFYLVSEYGISKRQTSLAIIVVELTYKGAALLIGLCYFFFSSTLQQYMPIMIILLACILIMMHPYILEKVLNFLLRLIKKPPVEIDFSYPKVLLYTLLFMVSWLLFSVAFYFLVISLTPIDSVNLVQFMTILPLCWMVGYIMIFAPGGIGVREGMLVIMLGEFMPYEAALVVAIFQRIWFTLIEGINVLISLPALTKAKNAETSITIEKSI